MSPKAIVHIGLAKTGTTSIQSLLASNRPELERQAFYFPRAGAINALGGHHCLGWSLASSAKAQEFCQGFRIPAFAREIEQRAGQQTVVVSSEELSSLSFSYMAIRSLLRLFPRHEVHVIAYVREQAEFFNSLYQEIVSDFADPGPIDAFVAKRLHEERYKYQHWFNIWNDLLGGRLSVRPFDRRVLKDGDVVADFLQAVGLRLTAAESDATRNTSWSNVQVAAALELIRRVETEFGERAAEMRVRRQLKQIAARLVARPELSAGERYWGIKESLVASIRRTYASPNAEFFRRYGFADFSFSAGSRVPAVTAVRFQELEASARARIEAAWTEMRHVMSVRLVRGSDPQ